MAFRFMGGGGQGANSWFGSGPTTTSPPPTANGSNGGASLNRTTSASDAQSPSRTPSGSTAAGIQFAMPGIPGSFPSLHNLSAQELSHLLNDPEAYKNFFARLDHVKRMDEVRDQLKRGNVELAKGTLSKESEIAQLHTQCRIIRGTELAAARERLEEMQRREREIISRSSPAVIISRLYSSAQEADEEAEELHRKFLAGEVEAGEFIQKYRKLRILYHTRMQTRLAALASLTNPNL